jgi:hypothetical protein
MGGGEPLKYNGRIDLSGAHEVPQYKRTLEGTEVRSEFSKEALKGNLNENELSQVYFSLVNTKALHQGIRYLVYKNTCGKNVISNQSDDELMIVMRSIYYQHSKNMPFNIIEQVRELNGLVLDYCVPKIVDELSMYRAYKRDITTLPLPMDHAVNESVKGTKVLEFKRF